MKAAVSQSHTGQAQALSLPQPNTAALTEAPEPVLLDRKSGEVVVYAGPGVEPIQLKVLARLAPGVGDAVYASGLQSLQSHPHYFFEEGEHSALIFSPGGRDDSAFYSLAVGTEPLTWHRHPTCAHRIITITTGSGGALARFSLATDEEIAADPAALLKKMITIELPADAQISIRFNGMTYHQFGPRDDKHPAFFGTSVHKNERGELSEVTAEGWQGTLLRSDSDPGSIPLLTKCLPEDTLRLLNAPGSYTDTVVITL